MLKREFYNMHADICKTISNPNRQAIIDNLREKEMSVTEIINRTGLSQANLSQHLGILRRNGIVETRREGAHIYYRISSAKVVKACQLMREVLLERLNMSRELARLVEEID